MLELLVTNDPAFLQVHQEHPARLEPALLLNLGRRDIQHTRLRGHNQLTVVGNGIAEGPQAVSVQEGADGPAIGGHNHRRAVPRLHQTGVVLVKVLFLLGHGLMLVPGFRNQHEHGVAQVSTGHKEEFQSIVDARRVAGPGGHYRRNLPHVFAEQGRLELGFPGVHPVEVAP